MVRILDDGLDAAVRLSHRYLPDRQLPDKAVSVLDTACARLALGQNATPPAVEDARRRLEDLAVQTRVLEREAAVGADHAERLAPIATAADGDRSQAGEAHRALGAGARAGQPDPRDPAAARGGSQALRRAPMATARAAEPASNPDALRAELATLTAELEALQGERR